MVDGNVRCFVRRFVVGFVSAFVAMVVFGLSFVFDVSDVAGVVVHVVGHHLAATVRKCNKVLALGVVSVAVLVVAHVDVSVVVLHGVVKVVVGRCLQSQSKFH